MTAQHWLILKGFYGTSQPDVMWQRARLQIITKRMFTPRAEPSEALLLIGCLVILARIRGVDKSSSRM
jgi:hypothetical protein